MAMSTEKPRPLLRIAYEEAAEAYLRSLPLEHFMEATAQGTQRKITLESLDLVHVRRPDVQVFNELLLQYPHGRHAHIRQVVPDNVVMLWPEPLKVGGSYDLPFQPTGPFWALEYVSKYTKRKDYESSFAIYERHLKVPYLLLFYPDNQELTLYHHSGRKYVSVRPNEHGRYAIPELEIEVALLDGWVRFWFRGELLPLPADLLRELDQVRHQLHEERQARLAADRRAEEERQARLAAEDELAQLRAQVEQLRQRQRNHK
jgi:Uma2 family endonuclease